MKNNNTKALSTILTVLFIALTVSVALASGDGGGEHAGSKWDGFIYQLANFAILVTILGVAAWKADLKGLIAGRSANIKASIEEARKAREAAETALAEVQAKLDSKDSQIAEMVSVSESGGAKERDRLIAEGERLSKLIVEQARVNIDLELRQAKDELKREAANLALELAEQKISKSLTAEDQAALFEEALKRLEDKS